MKSLLLALAFCVATALTPQSLSAQLIEYRFSGVGTGTLNQVAFSSRSFLFTFRAPASTAAPNVTNCGFSQGPTIVSQIGLAGNFLIDGLGSGEIGDAYVFQNNQFSTGGFGTCERFDLINGFSTPGYDLTSALAPVARVGPFSNSQFTNQTTTAGPLTFTRFQSATYEARVVAVPEPSGILLIAAPMLSMIAMRRRTLRQR